MFIRNRKEDPEQADGDHSEGGIHALMGAEQGDRPSHPTDGRRVYHHVMGIEFSGPVLDHRQSVRPIYRGQDGDARLNNTGFLGGDLTHGAAQHLHVV